MRIVRKGIESSQKLGTHPRVIERSIAWLFGYHRLSVRYDRKATHFLAFLALARHADLLQETSEINEMR